MIRFRSWLCTAILMSSYVSGAIGQDIMHDQQRKMVRFARQLVLEPILGLMPYMAKETPLINGNEYAELQLEEANQELDCAQTSFGTWGRKQRLIPLTNQRIIEQRILATKNVVIHESLYTNIERLLEGIWKVERDVLAYYEPDTIIQNIQRLYYDVPFAEDGRLLPKIGVFSGIKNFLNHNTVTLEGALAIDTIKAAISFSKVFLLQGILEEFMRWQYTTHENNDGFDWKRAIKRSASQIIRDHNPKLDVLSSGYNHTYAEFAKALFDGSLGDRYKAVSEWYDAKDVVKLPLIGAKTITTRKMTDSPKAIQNLWKMACVPSALLQTLWHDYDVYLNAKSSFAKVNFILKVNKELKTRMRNVAQFIRTAKRLHAIVLRDPILSKMPLAHNFNNVFGSRASNKLQKALRLLDSSTFSAKNTVALRGRMLLVNKLLSEVAEELVPLLQAIGELDAIVSDARLYKKYVGSATPMSFVSFAHDAQPVIDIRNGWLPVLSEKERVANSIQLGGQLPNHFLLTGPNGAGKSTILKMIGQAVVFAHGSGLIPASSAHMSFLSGLRTSLEPSEDLKNGLSSFMAEHKSMDEIYQFVHECPQDKKCLVLIDEPYRGTVSQETARLDGKYCTFVSEHSNCLSGMASHIMPNLSAPDAWSFYNMEIEEESLGVFRRTYRLKSGPAHWWFNDDVLRARYVDWLGNYKK